MTPTPPVRTLLLAAVVVTTVLSRPSVAQQPAKDGTIFFPAEKTAAGWANGGPLIETGTYKIHTRFSETSAPFLYYTVKVTGPASAK